VADYESLKDVFTRILHRSKGWQGRTVVSLRVLYA
jgi:hypothetical protein